MSSSDYFKAYHQRPDVKARDRARKRRKYATSAGRASNLAAVKRHYSQPENYNKKLVYMRARHRDGTRNLSAWLLQKYLRKRAELRGAPQDLIAYMARHYYEIAAMARVLRLMQRAIASRTR